MELSNAERLAFSPTAYRPKPLVTYLAYSAGVQSHAILEMILRGDMEKPPNFLVLIGKLRQQCTIHYKITPMRQALRRHLHIHFGYKMRTSKLPCVDALIGFAKDEAKRVKAPKKKDPKYIRLRYPFIELGLDRPKIEGYYLKNGIPKPPRSVCNACFANGLSYYRDMADNRPDDFDKACKFDEMNRDMSRYGVEDECFVSATCIPLRTLEEMDFNVGEKQAAHACNSGVCFL